MVTYEETRRSERNIWTMRHSGGVAMDLFPREWSWQAEEKPSMANQLDHPPRWRCRLGYFSGGVDRPYGKKTNERETSKRGAGLGGSSISAHRSAYICPVSFFIQTERRPGAAK